MNQVLADLLDPVVWLNIIIVIISIMALFFIVKYIRFLINRRREIKAKEKEINPIIRNEFKISDKVILKENLDQNKFYTEVDSRDYVANLPFITRYLLRRKIKKKPEKIVLVRMKMNNDTVIEKLIEENEKGFVYKDGHYTFDPKNKYPVISNGKRIMAYDFQESISLPYKIKKDLPFQLKEYIGKFNSELRKGDKIGLPAEQIKAILEESNTVSSAINPSNLKRYLQSNLIQQLVMALTSSKILRILFIMVIILLITVILDLFIDVADSGLLGDLIPKNE